MCVSEQTPAKCRRTVGIGRISERALWPNMHECRRSGRFLRGYSALEGHHFSISAAVAKESDVATAQYLGSLCRALVCNLSQHCRIVLDYAAAGRAGGSVSRPHLHHLSRLWSWVILCIPIRQSSSWIHHRNVGVDSVPPLALAARIAPWHFRRSG